MENKKRKEYFIPVNYKESSRILNGMVSKRNAVDACGLGLLGLGISRCLPLSSNSSLSVTILLVGILGMFGLTGIHQIPVSVYLLDLIRWPQRRKLYFYNNHGGVYTVSSADILLNTPQIRDSVADALDKFKARNSRKQIEYIEGETFEFAPDPYLNALAEAQRNNDAAAATAKQDTTAPAEATTTQNVITTDLDFKDICITLEDIEEGE